MKETAARVLAGCLTTLAFCLTTPTVAAQSETAAPLTAAQIVDRNVQARGGADAWRKIRSMVWVGHIERGARAGPAMRYILEMKRPGKRRFEIKAPGRMGVRIFDGKRGWKLNLTPDGYPNVEPYSAEEVKFARDEAGIGGPLMDYRSRGATVDLEGVDPVDGHKAYRLRMILPSGTRQHVWIDAESFLEVKEARELRNALGMTGTLNVFYRDYRAVDGVRIPFLTETGVGSDKATDKMVVDHVVVNVPIDDGRFARPLVPRRHAISIGREASAPVRAPVPAAPSMPQAPAAPGAGSLTATGHDR